MKLKKKTKKQKEILNKFIENVQIISLINYTYVCV